MADTLTDNSFASRSLGYLIRRGLFFTKFLKLLPLLAERTRRVNDGTISGTAYWNDASVSRFTNRRDAGKCPGKLSRKRAVFLRRAAVWIWWRCRAGRRDAFLRFTPHGFDSVPDWYSSNFVKPIVVRLDKQDFYRAMIELSMGHGDVFHLDARLVFHAFRLGKAGRNAFLGFASCEFLREFARFGPRIASRAKARDPGPISETKCNPCCRTKHIRRVGRGQMQFHSRNYCSAGLSVRIFGTCSPRLQSRIEHRAFSN